MLHDGKSFNLQIKQAPISSVVALLASTVWCKLVSDNHQIVAIAHMFTLKSLFFLGIVVDKVPYCVNSPDWQFSGEFVIIRGCNAHVPWNVHHSTVIFFCRHPVEAGPVRTTASVCQCTKKTITSVSVKGSGGKTVKKVRNTPRIQCHI